MTSVEQLAACRVILSEATANFYLDADIYTALADAQNQIITILLKIFEAKQIINPDAELSYELSTILASSAAGLTASNISVPTGFLWIVNASWDYNASGTEYPCYIVSQNKSYKFDEANSYLAATATSPKVYIAPVSGVLKINFLPAYDTGATYTLNYLASPAAIAAGQNPTLPVTTHQAMIHYACARMLFKDQRMEEANNQLQIFSQEISKLIG